MPTAAELIFEIQTQGADELRKVAAAVGAVEKSTSSATAELGRMDAQLAALVNALNGNTAALGKMAAASEAGAASVRKLGAAHAGLVSDVQATSGAIRVFEGALPIRAVEQFATKILGLGPAMQALFPIVGAVAVGEMLVHVGEKVYEIARAWDPVARAERAAHDEAREYEKTVDRLRPKLIALNNAAFLAAQGGINATARESAGNVQDARMLRAQESLPGAVDLRAGAVDIARLFLGLGLNPKEGLERQRQASERRGKLELMSAAEEGQASAGVRESSQQQQERNERRAADAADAAKKAAETTLQLQQRLQAVLDANLDPIQKIVAKRDEEIARLERIGQLTERNRRLVALAADEEQAQFVRKALAGGIEGARRLAASDVSAMDREENRSSRFQSSQFERKLRADIAQGEKDVRNDRDALGIMDKSDADRVQRLARRNQQIMELATPAAGPGGSAAREASIIEQSYRNRLDLAAQLFQIEARKADRLTDGEEKAKALAQARYEADKAADEAKLDREISLLQLQKKQLDEFRHNAGQIFDAITSRDPAGALKQWGINKARDIGRAEFEKLAESGLKASGLGGLLGIGASPVEKAQLATADYTRRTAEALESLGSPVGAIPGGTGNAPGSLPGLPGVTGPAASLLGKLFPTLGGNGAAGNFGAGLGSVVNGNALATVLGQNTAGTTALSGQIGAGVGLAGAGLAGAYGIYSGIHSGGASGNLMAAGSAAGLAGVVTANVTKALSLASPILSAIPVVGSIAALALPLLGSLFGQGAEHRSAQLDKELQAARFTAPQSIAAMADINGGFGGDYNIRGQVRGGSAGLLPYSTEQQGFYDHWNGSYVPVAGQRTGQYSQGPAATTPVTVTQVFNAIDAKSLMDRGADFADAVHQAVRSGKAEALVTTIGDRVNPK